MPKLGRPFINLENDLTETSRDKRRYMFDEGSEVTRNAPFGTNYTPRTYTKIIASKYKKFNGDLQINDHLDEETHRSCIISPQKEDINKRPILPPIYTESQRDYDLSELTSILPPGIDLPQKSIQLTNNEQLSLIKLTKYEIRILPDFILKLKEIYLLLAKIDFNLTGICSFKEFVEACYQQNVHLSWQLFRIIASQFVMSKRDDASFVNYEKIISFIGAVYQSLDSSERCVENVPKHKEVTSNSQDPYEKPVYYHNEFCTDIEKDKKYTENRFDVDETKLIQEINDDIGFVPIPLQRIRLAFQRCDSLHRGTLSVKQIWEIFQYESLIVRKDTFDKIIHHCKHMGAGQYNWQHLIELLERIQPISTGLQIPSSKMPIDYIKSVPAPASSWPHSEAFDTHHDISQCRMSPPPASNNASPRKDFCQQYFTTPPIAYEHNENMNTTKNQVPVTATPVPVEPWFNRFLKFVDSIYLKDINNRGILPTRELYEISSSLNERFGLKLSSTEIISALEGSAVDNDRLYSNINSFLKRLAIR